MWTRLESGQLHCATHGTTFGPLEQCTGCLLAKSAVVVENDALELMAAPAGCLTTYQHECEFLVLAEYADRRARSRAKGMTPGLSAKFLAESVKARRAAAQLAARREDDDFTRQLERRKERRRGKRRGRK